MPLSALQLEVACLVAEDRLSDLKIAKKHGISPRQIYRWKNEPEFGAEVMKLREAFAQQVRSRRIAVAENCVALADQLETRIVGLIKARAKDPEIASVPGGSTGLVTVKKRTIITDRLGNREEVLEYKFDRGPLAEIRAQQEHVHRLLGKWQDKLEVTRKSDTVFMGWDLDKLASLSDEEFDLLCRITENARVGIVIDVEPEDTTAPGRAEPSAGEPGPLQALPEILPGPGDGSTQPGALPEAHGVLPGGSAAPGEIIPRRQSSWKD